jgi:hypothetical protein
VPFESREKLIHVRRVFLGLFAKWTANLSSPKEVMPTKKSVVHPVVYLMKRYEKISPN